MDRSDNPADRRGQQPECGAFRTARAMRRFRCRSPAQQAVRTASASQVQHPVPPPSDPRPSRRLDLPHVPARGGEQTTRRQPSGCSWENVGPPTSTSPSAAPGCVPLLRTSPRCSSTTRASTIPSAPWTRSQAHVPDGGEIRCAVVGAGQETVARVPRGAGGGSCQRRAAPRGAARPTGSRATGCHVRAGSLWAGWGLVGVFGSVVFRGGVGWATLCSFCCLCDRPRGRLGVGVCACGSGCGLR